MELVSKCEEACAVSGGVVFDITVLLVQFGQPKSISEVSDDILIFIAQPYGEGEGE